MSTPRSQPPAEYVAALAKYGFELHELIGQGAAGSVFRATQTRLKRSVAVKIFDGRGARTAENRRRFDREHLLLAKTEHPAIPYVLTTGTLQLKGESVHYIAMQLIQGTRLSNILEHHGRMDATKAINTIQPILSALACAHRENIIHRDIAPDNIIVNNQSAYLIDFSIGICTEYEPGLTRLTHPGEKLGKQDYASPEQREDSSTVDIRTDLYSAGIVLFELLAGHPRLRIDYINQDLNHTSTELREIIKKACATNRNDRFSSADAFSDALKQLTGANLTVAGTPMRSLCPNTICGQANWSYHGYFRGPRIEDECINPRCDGCGTIFIKKCQKCHTSLSVNLKKLTTNQQKTNHDSMHESLQAHCIACGELIFKTPTCNKCGSLLKKEDMGQDTLATGCAKCRRHEANRSPTNTPPDDEMIPF
ncbi:serine/threonine protein kinase [Corallococcus sp. CA047B]|uniref:serine/threonine-protein kinase n=1 Tax=Corallococcus sp. CA047B TaxID=2316729 RepID=UPI000EA37560|nr:serine/threonine-protein kinase [Corallococcus sp. CA047B]RKH15277.1 serine/threonine protein kinase [Corallococcus sp. CA047B]